jgi:hypothetical protein
LPMDEQQGEQIPRFMTTSQKTEYSARAKVQARQKFLFAKEEKKTVRDKLHAVKCLCISRVFLPVFYRKTKSCFR